MISKFNVEKGVLVLAACWFLATGSELLNGPQLREWGPPRTFESARKVAGVDLDNVVSFPKGGRGDIFGWPRTREEIIVQQRKKARRRAELERQRRQARQDNGAGPSEAQINDTADADAGHGAAPVAEDRAPPRFVGTISVEDSGTYTFVADGDEYVAIAPGGGEAGRYRLVERSAVRIIIEDASGRRFSVPVP
jgi:hypothetical protein